MRTTARGWASGRRGYWPQCMRFVQHEPSADEKDRHTATLRENRGKQPSVPGEGKAKITALEIQPDNQSRLQDGHRTEVAIGATSPEHSCAPHSPNAASTVPNRLHTFTRKYARTNGAMIRSFCFLKWGLSGGYFLKEAHLILRRVSVCLVTCMSSTPLMPVLTHLRPRSWRNRPSGQLSSMRTKTKHSTRR